MPWGNDDGDDRLPSEVAPDELTALRRVAEAADAYERLDIGYIGRSERAEVASALSAALDAWRAVARRAP